MGSVSPPDRRRTACANRYEPESLTSLEIKATLEPRRRLQEVELLAPVNLVGRQSGLSLEQGRRRVVYAVVEDHDIGTVSRLKLANKRDQFLRADVADLGQVFELDAPSSLDRSDEPATTESSRRRGPRSPRATNHPA